MRDDNLKLQADYPLEIWWTMTLEYFKRVQSTTPSLELTKHLLRHRTVSTGTFVKLQYPHVKRDLEKDVIPIRVHVKAEITKGKYDGYNIFLGQEAAGYLKTSQKAERICLANTNRLLGFQKQSRSQLK